jgi:hypothetical protein
VGVIAFPLTNKVINRVWSNLKAELSSESGALEVLVMDKKVDIYKTMLALSETTLEGIEHIHIRAKEGRFEETADIFTDVADSFHEMRKALLWYYPEFEESALDLITQEVVGGMQLLLAAYEGDKDVRPLVVLQFSLVPGFQRWHMALQLELNSLCAPAMN